MQLDLILTNARIAGGPAAPVDIGIAGGRIAALAPALDGPTLGSSAPRRDLGGRLVIPGLVETHVHLDKSGLSGRCSCCQGSLSEAVAAVAAAKREFTEEDVYSRAAAILEKSILHGTTRMRTHVEVDPRIGLTSLRALLQLKRDYAWAIDLEICAFPQEGLIDDPGCEAVLVAALEAGADLVGGAPYMDRDSHGHIGRIFDIARRFDVDIDFHLDFSLDASRMDIGEVCRCTDLSGWGGRVAVGHATKLSMLPAERLNDAGRRLAASGVAVTVLPSTDLYLMGRDADHAVPRGVAPARRLQAMGVTCSLSTNNVLNPFTPYGDCSLLRIANLYANVDQLGTEAELEACLGMVTTQAARLMRIADYGIAPGMPADIVVLDCRTAAQAVAELAPALLGYKGGRQSFERSAPRLMRPAQTLRPDN